MSDSDSVVTFLSDPSTLLALGAVAMATAWYLNRSAIPVKPLVPLDNQSLEVPVSLLAGYTYIVRMNPSIIFNVGSNCP